MKQGLGFRDAIFIVPTGIVLRLARNDFHDGLVKAYGEGG